MSKNLDRRSFLRSSLVGSAAFASAMSLEEKALLAAMQDDSPRGRGPAVDGMPAGRIGNVTISRIICGGNLIGGYAHSRDLIYVSSLLKHYFTDEKIIETLTLCEESGVNTINAGTSSLGVLKKYWDERGGRIQWLAQCVPSAEDLTGDVQKAIDAGATGAYVIGNVGDAWTRAGRVDLIGKVVDFIRQNGLPAGIGGHKIETIQACVEAGLKPDFWVKTLHRTNYWSARTEDEYNDNCWCLKPEDTIAYMNEREEPWIAFKVLAAGAIAPKEGIRYAFENGADFVCLGMYDFQVVEDTNIAWDIFNQGFARTRPWRA